MPESAEEIYARVVAEVGEHARPAAPPISGWDVFPWEVVDGAVAPKALRPPEDDPPRWGEVPEKPCPECAHGGERAIWENDRFRVIHLGEPSGLPLVLMLVTREHLDYTDLDDEHAAELGMIAVWLARIGQSLPGIARVHVDRWGDGGEHCHVWFFARPARLPQIIGSYAVEWDDILPPVPEERWRADLATVAAKLANHDGRALV